MTKEQRRVPLSRERILQAAIDVADREGLEGLTMRRLGAELGVEAMAVYKHVSGKDDILDGMVELVVSLIETPGHGMDWRDAMRRRARSARDVLTRHSWAIGLLDSRRSMGPNQLRYVDSVLGSLRSAGFSIDEAAHAFSLLDSYVYGHVVQEMSMSGVSRPGEPPGPATESEAFSTEYPHLAEMATHAAGGAFSFDGEFGHGLDVILSALEPGAAKPDLGASGRPDDGVTH
jgi:AcrR family transcriptional regulator